MIKLFSNIKVMPQEKAESNENYESKKRTKSKINRQ